MWRSDCEEKGKTASWGDGKPGTVDEDVSDSQFYIVTGTHRSRPAGRVVPMSQPSVPQPESIENHLLAAVPLKRRGPGDGGTPSAVENT